MHFQLVGFISIYLLLLLENGFVVRIFVWKFVVFSYYRLSSVRQSTATQIDAINYAAHKHFLRLESIAAQSIPFDFSRSGYWLIDRYRTTFGLFENMSGWCV